MPYSEAQKRASRKYNEKAYANLEITVPKAKKEIIKAFADSREESVNSLVNRLLDETMNEFEPFKKYSAELPTGRKGEKALLSLFDFEKENNVWITAAELAKCRGLFRAVSEEDLNAHVIGRLLTDLRKKHPSIEYKRTPDKRVYYLPFSDPSMANPRD